MPTKQVDPRDRIKHIAMMETPERWPVWPRLPLKRWRDGQLETAFLVATGQGGAPVAFFEGLVFQTLTPEMRAQVVSKTPTQVYDEGWRVD